MSDLLARFRAGDRRALARLLTHVEHRTPLGRRAEREAFPLSGNAHLVGVTGPPGAGKSTLIAAFVREARSHGHSVAVLAVDPTSPVSGGALMGDRIRMLEFSADDGVFVRSLTSRGRSGGIAPALCAMAHVLDAFGFDLVLLETVGAGQDDTDIARLADTTVLVLVPGLGDSVQALKAGTLEVADIYVVNKADLPGAQHVARDLHAMQRLNSSDREPVPVVQTVATTGRGIDTLYREVASHRQRLVETGQLLQRAQSRLLFEVRSLALETVERQLDAAVAALDPGLIDELLARRLTPTDIAERLTTELRLIPPEARP